MRLLPTTPDPESLARYAALFKQCFPKTNTLDVDYLRWLYEANPAGNVIGFDAWADTELAAHYVCVPAQASVNGRIEKVLLSLNTATAPAFQGRGLFTKLAEATYSLAADRGFAAVYGIANANSTPGFVRKLGFTLVSPLAARVGLGRIDGGEHASTPAGSFQRVWNEASLSWRISNPKRSYRLVRVSDDVVGAEARTGWPGLRAWAEVSADATSGLALRAPSAALRLHLGLRPAGTRSSGYWIDTPERFRPSPLNLIFKPLGERIDGLDRDHVSLGQLDFDAF